MKSLFNKFFPQQKIGLLPYIREDISGDDIISHQNYGWELKKFNIPDIWIKSRGTGVKIAVIDTGCDIEHEDLKYNIISGKNFVNKNEPPLDKNGHGTHVAGTIAASNNNTGMVGVAPESKIIPVKCLNDDGMGNIDHIISGIYWAVDNDADFITMSLGAPNTTPKMEKALDYAKDKGVVVFCAAGNSGPTVDIMYPAKYDSVIATGAIDHNLRRTSFTCSGESLDFLAPGQDILSCVPHNKYALMSGTSMSNPFITGCASLLLSWNRVYNKYHLSNNNDYIDIFKQHTIPLKDTKYQQKQYQGYGIINPITIFNHD